MASMGFLATLNAADRITLSGILALAGPFVVYTSLEHLDQMREIESNMRDLKNTFNKLALRKMSENESLNNDGE
ncbi:hypothetical protein LguiA_004269 [Lonicera macranthoides]